MKGEVSQMKNVNMGGLKATGIIMIIFAIIYALVGSMALAGVITGALPGHETQETLIVLLGYLVALLALVCGIVCIKGMTGAAKVMGIIFALLGLAALLYQQIAHDTFSIFDCLALCFGVSIYYIASKAEKEVL